MLEEQGRRRVLFEQPEADASLGPFPGLPSIKQSFTHSNTRAQTIISQNSIRYTDRKDIINQNSIRYTDKTGHY